VLVVGNITSWSKISSGYHHNIAINSGVAYAWGSGGGGQLGNGGTTAVSSPVTVVGGITTWSQVSASGGASGQHSLGITSAGIAYAWGYNGNGQLGDGTTTSRLSPVTVVGGITTWSQLSAGGTHSLGRTSAGVLYAWGANNYGQLGINTTSGRSSPVTVVGGITTWSQFDSANRHSLGLTSAGIAYAWGVNYRGQLGDNTGTSRSSPVTVVGGITTWNQVSGGSDQNIALTSAGVLYAWGGGDSGQIGDGFAISRSSPVTVVGGITPWSQFSAGCQSFGGGLTSAGVLYVWGYNNSGKLGINTTTARSSPVTVVGGITTWSQISAGGQQFLA
jgi:alpha-tubulin suppressor-like RCC1 family protein